MDQLDMGSSPSKDNVRLKTVLTSGYFGANPGLINSVKKTTTLNRIPEDDFNDRETPASYSRGGPASGQGNPVNSLYLDPTPSYQPHYNNLSEPYGPLL